MKGDMTAAKQAFEQMKLNAISASTKRRADIYLKRYIEEEE